MNNLQKIEPKKVFTYFEEISNIPRGSGNQKEISDYLLNFGKKLGLESIQDETLNIIIKKPATKGYESAPIVIIQGHMDMVCEKNNGTIHDFEKDPIELRIVDDFIYANGTTLGADNGIAMAYAMAILASDDIEHPAIEVLMTTDEETGMFGAMALSREHIDGKILINLDSEEEGYLLVSCAGGVRTTGKVNIQWQDSLNKDILKISISGLKGGHSGMDIIKERGNSNKLLGRILNNLLNEVEFNLVSLNGGSKNNAIPREAEAIITIKKDNKEKSIALVNEFKEKLMNELRAQDSGLTINIEHTDSKVDKEFTIDCTKRVVKLLYLYPNGINTKSVEIKDLVESSTNLGVVTTNDNIVEFDSAIRSSVASLKEDIVLRMKEVVEIYGGDFETSADYPAWEYDPKSEIREICKTVYKNMNGKEANIIAIHAGVECGLFKENLGDLDMISFGPNLFDVHTPDEHMSISSVQNIWEYLKEILKNIK